jgi:hypothetical protein
VGSLVIDGVVLPVVIDASPDGRELIVSGGGVRWVLKATGPGGAPLPLAPDGSLVLSQSGGIPMAGSGFAPGSMVKLFMFSTATSIGSAVARGDGSYGVRATIPAKAAVGSHTIQVAGMNASGQSVALSMGVTVKTPAAARGAHPSVRIVGDGPHAAGKLFGLRVRGMQTQCMVKLSVSGSTAIARADVAGRTQSRLRAPGSPGNWPVTATVYGDGCDRVTAVTRVQVSGKARMAWWLP